MTEDHRCSTCDKSIESSRGIVLTCNHRPASEYNADHDCRDWVDQAAPLKYGVPPMGEDLPIVDAVPEGLMTLKQAATKYAIDWKSLYYGILNGRMGAEKYGRCWYVRLYDVEHYLKYLDNRKGKK